MHIPSLNPQLPTVQKGDQEAKIRAAAQEFEALLVGEIYKAMRKTVPNSGLVDGGFSTEMFTGMLDEQVAQLTAQRGSLGLAETLARDLGVKTDRQIPDSIDQILRLGDWVTPLEGHDGPKRAAQAFGAERPGDRPDECGGGHCGVDFGEVIGTPVRAVGQATVARINDDPEASGGRSVILRHRGGLTSTYMHLDSVADIAPGDTLPAGTTIGAVGDTGPESEGAHLHFEMALRLPSGATQRINPETYLGLWRQNSPKSAQVSTNSGDVTDGSRERLAPSKK